MLREFGRAKPSKLSFIFNSISFQKDFISLHRCKNQVNMKMEKNEFPIITTVVQAKPWAKGQVAHFISTRAVSRTPKKQRVITSNILPK